MRAQPPHDEAQIRVFWSSFSIIFPFHEVEPDSIRAPEETRLRRAVHRQKAVLANPDSLTLVAKNKETGEIVGYAGYLKPSGCFKPHPWIAEDESLVTEEDKEAWEGVDRKHWNSEFRWPERRGGSAWLTGYLVRFMAGLGRLQVQDDEGPRPLVSLHEIASRRLFHLVLY